MRNVLLCFFCSILFSAKLIAQTNTPIEVQEDKYENDSLFSVLIKDSLFIEFKFVEFTSFNFLITKKQDTTFSKYIKFNYYKLEEPDVKKTITELKNKGIEEPEFFYLLNNRKLELFRSIYLKYPGLRKYSGNTLSKIVYFEKKK